MTDIEKPLENNIENSENDLEPQNNSASLKTDDALAIKDNLRSIGRWYIGETLGKGGYSWVKKGYDKKTGKSVALKFMAKAENSWINEQSKQVINEIDALKQIKSSHVIKLYAYNVNAKYPAKNKEKIDSILLVLEYAPGGELFDILYYTCALEEDIARTYFLQLISGIEACHDAGICHRDIKPQNLLLDSKFNLKLTDFGLSKIFKPDETKTMKTTYVGTKGYQAPELLLSQSYESSCDIFSAGVVLFILLNGYPPFEQASSKDRWYAPIANNDYAKFWKYHKGCIINNNEKIKDLIQQMLCYDPKKRITIQDIKKHAWCLEKVLDNKELINALRSRHKKMESKRKQDVKKLTDLQTSIVKRNIVSLNHNKNDELPYIDENEIEGISDMYSTVYWKDIYNVLADIIAKNGGHVELNDNKLTCMVKTMTNDKLSITKFEISIWKSREFNNKTTTDNNNNEIVYVIKCKRLEGNSFCYRQIIQELIQLRGSSVVTGLPSWAEKQFNDHDINLNNFSQINEDNDYDQILEQDSDKFVY